MPIFKYALILSYLLSIVAGVVAIDIFGVVPVGFGLMAPAGVYVIGVTLVLRDLVHEAAGRRAAFLAVAAGAGLAALVSPGLALASGVAFLVAETLDLLVFEKVRARISSLPTAILVSNAISIPVDSAIFLGLAFGSMEFFAGQLVGKSIATVLALAFLVAVGTATLPLVRKKAEKAEAARRASLSEDERRNEDYLRALSLR